MKFLRGDFPLKKLFKSSFWSNILPQLFFVSSLLKKGGQEQRKVRMRNIKIIVEYDGKKFNGWQNQPDKINIQGSIEKAIKEITGETVKLYASR